MSHACLFLFTSYWSSQSYQPFCSKYSSPRRTIQMYHPLHQSINQAHTSHSLNHPDMTLWFWPSIFVLRGTLSSSSNLYFYWSIPCSPLAVDSNSFSQLQHRSKTFLAASCSRRCRCSNYRALWRNSYLLLSPSSRQTFELSDFTSQPLTKSLRFSIQIWPILVHTYYRAPSNHCTRQTSRSASKCAFHHYLITSGWLHSQVFAKRDLTSSIQSCEHLSSPAISCHSTLRSFAD